MSGSERQKPNKIVGYVLTSVTQVKSAVSYTCLLWHTTLEVSVLLGEFVCVKTGTQKEKESTQKEERSRKMTFTK